MKKRYLILEDGTIFQGIGFGADVPVIGELVFNTNVVGYVETLTDPCNYGQIVMQTFPMVGNYGIMEEDFEGEPALRGYVVKEYCQRPSNFRCEYDLDTFLKQHQIPGLCGVDTRELTNRIREFGVVNAMITDTLPDDLDEIAAYTITDAVESVTSKEPREYPAEGTEQGHVVLVDYGTKRSLIHSLTRRGLRVTTVPAGTCAEDILSRHPDGIVLSEGPGDPRKNPEAIAEIQKLAGSAPLFAVGLGHEMLALSMGGEVFKLKAGHHGGNQPCHRVGGTRTYITAQNHDYAVDVRSVPDATVSFININDNTCAGLEYPDKRAFSVQFDPESCTGPGSHNELFETFMAMMKED